MRLFTWPLVVVSPVVEAAVITPLVAYGLAIHYAKKARYAVFPCDHDIFENYGEYSKCGCGKNQIWGDRN